MSQSIPNGKGLHEAASGSFAFLQPDGDRYSNARPAVGGAPAPLADTLFDLHATPGIKAPQAETLRRRDWLREVGALELREAGEGQ